MLYLYTATDALGRGEASGWEGCCFSVFAVVLAVYVKVTALSGHFLYFDLVCFNLIFLRFFRE